MADTPWLPSRARDGVPGPSGTRLARAGTHPRRLRPGPIAPRPGQRTLFILLRRSDEAAVGRGYADVTAGCSVFFAAHLGLAARPRERRHQLACNPHPHPACRMARISCRPLRSHRPECPSSSSRASSILAGSRFAQDRYRRSRTRPSSSVICSPGQGALTGAKTPMPLGYCVDDRLCGEMTIGARPLRLCSRLIAIDALSSSRLNEAIPTEPNSPFGCAGLDRSCGRGLLTAG